jgi:hypothetical protein
MLGWRRSCAVGFEHLGSLTVDVWLMHRRLPAPSEFQRAFFCLKFHFDLSSPPLWLGYLQASWHNRRPEFYGFARLSLLKGEPSLVRFGDTYRNWVLIARRTVPVS